MKKKIRVYTRDELIDICTKSVVPASKWNDRDSYSAQVNITDIYSLLKAGCEYGYSISDRVINIEFRNITRSQYLESSNHRLNIDSIEDYLELNGEDAEMFYRSPLCIPEDLFKLRKNPKTKEKILVYSGNVFGYIPTPERLLEVDGDDWY